MSIKRKSMFTPKQEHVISYLVRGYTLKDIAERLCIKEDSVKSHIRSIFSTLYIRSRNELKDRLVEVQYSVLDHKVYIGYWFEPQPALGREFYKKVVASIEADSTKDAYNLLYNGEFKDSLNSTFGTDNCFGEIIWI